MTDLGPAGDAPTPLPPTPLPHRRRWLLRTLAALVLLLTLIAAGAQIILSSTDLPRQIALARLQEQTGLNITAAKLSTGWRGHTRLHNVTIALPLASQAFLDVPLLEVSHNTLPSLLLDRPLILHQLRLVEPRLMVRQSSSGTWNVAEALTLALRTLEQQRNRALHPNQLLSSLQLSIENATVILTDNADRTATFAPVNIHGVPASAGTWQCAATVASQLRLEGRIAPAQNWEHQLAFSLQQVDQFLKPWFPNHPNPAHVTGSWHGRLINDGVSGNLELANSQLGPADISGILTLQATGSAITLKPESLTAGFRDLPASSTRITGGSLHLQHTHIRAEALNLHLQGGVARVDAAGDWKTQAGRLEVSWADLTLPGNTRHSGRFQAALDTPLPSRPRITGTLHSTGTNPQGRWNSQLALSGQGQSWSSIDWQLSFPEATWTGQPTNLTLNNLTATLVTTPPLIRLTELRLPDRQRLSGTGQFHLKDRQWQLALKAHQLPLPRLSTPANIDLALAGDSRRIALDQFQLLSGNTTVSAKASYAFDGSKPLDAEVHLQKPSITLEQPTLQDTLAGGLLRGQARLIGTLSPLQADVTASMQGQKVFLGKRQLGDVNVQLAGQLNSDGFTLQSQELNLLDGHWILRGHYAFADGSADVGLDLHNMPLKQVDGLLASPINLEGILQASLKLDLPQGERDRLAVAGDWQVNNFAKKDLFEAERIIGRLSVNPSTLQLTDIRLHQQAGRAQAQLQYNLRDRTRLALQAEFDKWPVRRPQQSLDLTVSGRTKLDVVATTQPAATGPLELSTSVRHKNQDLGTIQLKSLLQGRQLQVSSLNADLIGATVTGQANLVFDDWLNSSAKLAWHNLKSQALLEWFPLLQGLQGTVAGSLEATKTTDPRVTEPLTVRVELQPQGTRFRGMDIGPGSMVLLLGRTSQSRPPLPDRAVLDRCTFQVAGGQVNLWGRASTHNGSLFSLLHTQVDFQQLDLNELVHAAEPNAEPMIGRLAGQITFYGPRHNFQQLAGEARIRLTHSDLSNSDIVAAFHQKYGLKRETVGAAGTGSARLRVENGTVELNSLRYRIKGLEMRAYGRLQNPLEGIDGSFQGFAIGSARPLRDIKLPYFAELDDILNALQTSVTTFRIGGTIRQPTVTPAAFSDINQSIRDIIIGEFRSESAE